MISHISNARRSSTVYHYEQSWRKRDTQCAPPLPFLLWGGVEPPTKFLKRGELEKTSILKGIAGKKDEGDSFKGVEGWGVDTQCTLWDSWLSQHGFDPIRCDLNIVLEFLTEIFHNKIYGYRPAISTYHDSIGPFSVGKNTCISSLKAHSQV